jgi:hypothetical protein
MKLILSIPLAILLFAFRQTHSSTKETDATRIDSIIAYKLSPGGTSTRNIECNRIKFFFDAKKLDLTKFESRIFSNLKRSLYNDKTQDLGIEARGQILIYRHSGQVDTICICNWEDVVINNKLYRLPSRDLLYLLDSMYVHTPDK